MVTSSAFNAWGIWGLAAVFYAYEFIHRIAPSAMIPELMQDFNATATQLGLFSAIYYYLYAFFQIPAGIIIDRYNLRWVLGGAAFLVALGSFLQSIALSLSLVIIGRSLVGIGSAFGFIACVKIGTYWFSPTRLPLIIGLTNLFGVIGALIGGGPLALLVESYGWRLILWYGSSLGFGLTAVLILCVQKGPFKQEIEKSFFVAPSSLISSFLNILRSSQTWLISLYACLLVAPLAAFGELWSIPFLEKQYEISRALATLANSIIFVGIGVGGPLLGWMASQQYYSLLSLMRFCVLAAFLSFLLILSGHSIFLSFLWLFLYGFFTSNMLLCFSFISFIHPKSSTGMAIGFINTLVTAGGALFQPFIGHFIDEMLSLEAPYHLTILSNRDFQIAFIPLLICFLLALFSLRFILVPDVLKKYQSI